MAQSTRGVMRSFKTNQLSRAIAAGMAAMVTLAATAPVIDTPVIMQMVNKKLPKKDSKNSSVRALGVKGASAAGRRNQPAMATTPMPKRSQASSKTGKAAASGLDSATYAPTIAMLSAK